MRVEELGFSIQTCVSISSGILVRHMVVLMKYTPFLFNYYVGRIDFHITASNLHSKLQTLNIMRLIRHQAAKVFRHPLGNLHKCVLEAVILGNAVGALHCSQHLLVRFRK